jgi:hypothetical protein
MIDPLSSSPNGPDTVPLTAERLPLNGTWALRLGLLGGLALAGAGLVSGSIYLILNLNTHQPSAVQTLIATVGFSIVFVAMIFGLALAMTARQGLQLRLSPPFRPRIWLVAGLFLVSLVAGQLVLTLDLASVYLFPLLHVLSTSLPPLLLLALVMRIWQAERTVITRRQAIAGLFFGAIVVTGLAFSLELLALTAALAAGAVFIAIQPGGITRLETLLSQVQEGSGQIDQAELIALLQNPWTIVALFVGLAVVVPVIEETGKGLAVPILSRWYAVDPRRGWFWGLLAGAGFAITESIFNSAIDLRFWIIFAVLRAGTAVLHCTTAGLTGLGWAQSMGQGRQWPLWRNFGLALTGHAAWNGMTVILVAASVQLAANEFPPLGPALIVVVTMAALVLLGLGVLGALLGISYDFRGHQG